jgi:hypothetical protein
MEDYKYSSYSAYLSEKETLLNKQEVLDWFEGVDSFVDNHKMIINDQEINKLLKL